MARKRLVTLNLDGQATKMEPVTVYIDVEGKACSEDKANKKVESSCKVLDGIGSVDLAVKVFGTVENLLKFVTSKINTQLQAEHKLMIVNREAGPEKIIASTIERLKKAGTSEDLINQTVEAMRAVLL